MNHSSMRALWIAAAVFAFALFTIALNAGIVVWMLRAHDAARTPAPLGPPPSPTMQPLDAWDADHERAFDPDGTSPSPTPTPRPVARAFYIVASPESNGNRFLVRLLLAAGCGGASGHNQPFDVAGVAGWPNLLRAPAHWPRRMASMPCLAMHRSMPHGGEWVDLGALVAQVKAAGWTPRILISLRAEDVARHSQVIDKHAPSASVAEARILRAQRVLVEALAALPDVWFRLVLYERLGEPHYVDWLFRRQMGLALPAGAPRWEDRNTKYLAMPN